MVSATDILKSGRWQLEPGEIVLGEKTNNFSGEAILDRKDRDIKEERTMFSKKFDNKNGTFSKEIFLSPIHYLDTNNRWQDIDTTIVRSKDKDYDYMNITNLFETYFSLDPFGERRNVKYKVGDAWMEFRSLSSLVSNEDYTAYTELKDRFREQRTKSFLGLFNYYRPSNDERTSVLKDRENTLRYPKVLEEGSEEIYIDYSISTLKLLEEIILTEYQDVSTFSQNVVLHNVYAREEGDTIAFYNKTTDKKLWYLASPVMYEYFERWDVDTHNPSRFENYGLKYETRCLNESCSNLIISKTLTEEGLSWLKSEDRKYPVIIDLTADYDFTDTADNWAYEKGGAIPTNQLNYDLVASTTDYTAISSSNDSRWSSALATSTGDYDSQIFRFTMDEVISEIASIEFQWEGYGSTPGTTTTNLNVWKSASSSWELIDSIDFDSTSDLVASGTISSDISSYIDASTTISVMTSSEKTTFDDGESCTADLECTSGYCYRDIDSDDYAAASGDKVCKALVPLGSDCNDGNAAIHPGATEICDATDMDCDGQEYTDDSVAVTTTDGCDQDGSCSGAKKTCQEGGTYGACDILPIDSWISTARNGSFDNNCDGVATKYLTDLDTLGCYNYGTNPMYCSRNVCEQLSTNPGGWSGTIAECGVTADWSACISNYDICPQSLDKLCQGKYYYSRQQSCK